ncbi:MAG: tetratricopeptide repeat protein [Planctomycetes bacterium]|nr:tetratricopeptide repeat protein [Planctomycetota bacterium]
MADHFERAKLHFDRGAYRDALRELDLELASDPECSASYRLKALSFMHLGDTKQALQFALKSVELAPDEAAGFHILSLLYDDEDRLALAEKHARHAVELEPDDADYWGGLALVLVDSHQAEQAVEAARHGLELDAYNACCLRGLALASIRLGNPGEAEQAATNLLSENPDDDVGHTAMGWVYLQHRDYETAKRSFQRALELDPHSSLARNGMASALREASFLSRSRFDDEPPGMIGRIKWWEVALGLLAYLWLLTGVFGARPGKEHRFWAASAVGATLYAVVVVPSCIGNFRMLLNSKTRSLLDPHDQKEAMAVMGIFFACIFCGVVFAVSREPVFLILGVVLAYLIPLVWLLFWSPGLKRYAILPLGAVAFLASFGAFQAVSFIPAILSTHCNGTLLLV